MKRILVIGSSNMDFRIRVHQLPKPGETLLSQSLENIPGGKGGNQAYAVGKLGGDGVFLSAVGADAFGETLIESMCSSGIDASCMRRCLDCPTGNAMVFVSDAGENQIVVTPGANSCCDLPYLKQHAALFHDCKILLIQMEIPLESVLYALQAAKTCGNCTILNPAPVPEKFPEEIFPLLDYITPNETELVKLAGSDLNPDSLDDVRTGCRRFLQKGVHNVLVTLGKRGAFLCNRQTERLFLPPEGPALDTTAAGDTFNGAFAVMLANGRSPEEAICFANAAATISVSRKGAQSSIPSFQEVLQFQASL